MQTFLELKSYYPFQIRQLAHSNIIFSNNLRKYLQLFSIKDKLTCLLTIMASIDLPVHKQQTH